MANLTVWKFNEAGGAQRALEIMAKLQKEHLSLFCQSRSGKMEKKA